jgi:hypothetical protein
MPPPLNEESLRRAEFSEGTRIRLADGQEWTFPKPWIRLFPRRGQDGKIDVGGGLTFGSTFNELLDEYVELDEDKVIPKVGVQFRMACLLLVQNYDLSDKQLEQLLIFEPDNDDNLAMWRDELLPLLLGIAPKPSADGSATPSSPTA